MLFKKPHSRPICHIRILSAENCQQRSNARTHTHTHAHAHTHTHISVVATALQQCNTRANCLFISQHVVREANGIRIIISVTDY